LLTCHPRKQRKRGGFIQAHSALSWLSRRPLEADKFKIPLSLEQPICTQMTAHTHLVLVSLAPHSLGLWLHTTHGIKHSDGAVQHTQGTLHLCVNVCE